jgi:hypothetical protein
MYLNIFLLPYEFSFTVKRMIKKKLIEVICQDSVLWQHWEKLGK